MCCGWIPVRRSGFPIACSDSPTRTPSLFSSRNLKCRNFQPSFIHDLTRGAPLNVPRRALDSVGSEREWKC